MHRLLLLGLLTACTPASRDTGPTNPPVEERAWNLRVFATGAESETTFERMLDQLAEADFVLVGETHTDDQTHRLETAILEGLAARKKGKVVLSMEMFQRDVQATLDDYLAGKIDEAAFLEASRPWGNYRTGYRPMIESAKASGVPVVAANLPRSLQMKFAMKGKAAADGLSDEERGWFPAEIHPPAESYWARIQKRLRDAGHGMMASKDSPDARKYSVQNLWDNSMADAAVKAHAEGTTVIHVAGGFHVEYADGVAAQIRHRKPEAKVATVTLVPVTDLRLQDPLRDKERADYIVYALADAQGLNAGRLSVSVPSTLRYRLHAPPAGDEPRPLLVWLDWAGGSTKAAAQLWTAALGSDVIVAVVEPPYRETAPDLRVTGRWAWPDTYGADQGRVVDGVERIVEYLGDRWTIDPKRVVVAGVGAGGDAALWTALYGGLEGATAVAVQPDAVSRLGEAGLPSRTPPVGKAVIIADEARVAPATKTLELAGVETELEAPRLHEVRGQMEARLRAGLGLPARTLPTEVKQLVIPATTPVAWQWGMLHARLRERDGKARYQVIPAEADGAEVLAVKPEQFEDGMALPTAPGPFGGTTILVLPPKADAAERKAWLALGEKDVIKARSRFARLQVFAEADLGKALDAIRDAGKRSVLIVPAAFVVGPERMKALQAQTAGHDHELEIAWLPGLGGELARTIAK